MEHRMEEALWRQERQKIIGGSEIPAILGLHPFRSRYAVWLDKTGKAPPLQENKYMRAGKLLEPVIVKLWQQETGHIMQEDSADNTIYYHPQYSFIGGTPDRLYRTASGEQGVLECKNTRLVIDPTHFPIYWWAQLQYYLGLTHSSIGEVAWFYQGVDLFRMLFEFSPEFYDLAVNAAQDFWENHVLKDIPPQAYGNDLNHFFAIPIVGKSLQALPDTLSLVNQIKTIRQELEILEIQQQTLLNQLKMIMQDSEYLLHDKTIVATWKINKSSKRILLIK
jgi:putative phage-type endonuclease